MACLYLNQDEFWLWRCYSSISKSGLHHASVFYAGSGNNPRFDAKKASKAGTAGLVECKVRFISMSGVVKDVTTGVWSKVVGTLKDDGLGEMTALGDDKWQN